MLTSALILRLTLDVLVDAGVVADLPSARRYVTAKLADLASDPSFVEMAAAIPPLPGEHAFTTRPDVRAALDGLAGAFLQASEHFELLAEPPQARMAYAAAEVG